MLSFIDLNFSASESGIYASLEVSGITISVEMPSADEGGYQGKWVLSTWRHGEPVKFDALGGCSSKDMLNNLDVNYLIQKIQEELGY